ncbi:MAG: hypothetical protein ACI4U3_03025 [Traorella sp.]
MSKDKFGITIDLVLLMLYTVSSIFLSVQLFLSKDILIFIRILILVLLIVLLGSYFILIFKSRKLVWLRRTLLMILCILIMLLSYSIYQMNLKSNSAAHIIQTYYQMNLLSDEDFNSSSDLDNEVIGVMMNDRNYFQSFDDVNKAFKTKNCLIKEFYNLDTLVESFKKDKIQAIILSDQNLDILKNEYPAISSHLSILSQNQHIVEVSHKEKNLDYQKPFTILLTLSDTTQLNYVSLTSSCYFLLIDPVDLVIKFIPIPTDLYIPNVAYDSYPDALYNVSYNGIDNLLYSIESIFGIEFDYFVKANQDTFVKTVDIMQGINMDISICDESSCTYEKHMMNQSSTKEYLQNQGDLYPILEGIFEKRDELIGAKLINFLKNYRDNTFSNLSIDALQDLINYFNQNDWKIEKVETLELSKSNEICISYGSTQKFEVSIMSEDYMNDLYQNFIDLKHIDEMKNFIFDLNVIHHSYLYPNISKKIVTVENMNWKIDEYYAVLPELTIQPVEVEKWQGNINFEKPNFDPYGLIYPIE